MQINFHLSIFKIKRVSISIPDWADDVHVTYENKIKYYKGCDSFFIDLPKCRKSKEISITPHYDRHKNSYNTDRKVVVDLFF